MTRLDHYIKTNLVGYSSNKTRDILKLSHNNNNKHIVFVFKNGSVVSWGIKRHQIDTYLNIVKMFGEKPVPFLVRDEFSYKIGDKTAIEPHDFLMWIV
ncbi:RMD1 family protein [Legionella tunisiensis]|uniref:RMD1 family protein n=1 Tax=Legionella tunisiensis TaxID=1034944 RepID=UPI0022B2F16E|nr:RMD1 family protein [Legionella tunisiensis]